MLEGCSAGLPEAAQLPIAGRAKEFLSPCLRLFATISFEGLTRALMYFSKRSDRFVVAFGRVLSFTYPIVGIGGPLLYRRSRLDNSIVNWTKFYG